MQSFLAESAPHRGRAIALASAGLLVLVTIATAIGVHHQRPYRTHPRHHGLHTVGHCATETIVVRNY